MFLWSLCFPLIAFGLSVAPPLYFGFLRAGMTGAILLLLAFALRRPMPRGLGVWLNLLWAGIGSVLLGFSGMFLAAEWVSPGIATVIANFQPLIAAGLAYVVLGERLTSRSARGMAIGLVGIIITALPSLVSGGAADSLAGVGLILLGAIGVAVSNVFLKRLAGQIDPLMATGWQFVLGSLPLLLIAAGFETPGPDMWSVQFALNLLILSLVGTALAYVLWFWLLQRSTLNRLNVFTFLTPIFGLILGAVFFGERLAALQVAGVALTILAVGQLRPPEEAQATVLEDGRK